MERIKANMPMMVFIVYSLKSLQSGVSSIDVAALFVLGLLYAVTEFMVEKKELKQINDDVSSLKETVEELKKRNEELKTHVSGLKIGQQMRPGQFNGR